jgi:hypothetical protein
MDVILGDDIEEYQRQTSDTFYKREIVEFGEAVHHINIAARFGAVQIFKFLLLENCIPHLNAKESIHGGNTEIIRICKDHKVDVMSTECLNESVRSLRFEISEWILNQNPNVDANGIDKIALEKSNAFILSKMLKSPEKCRFVFINPKSNGSILSNLYSETVLDLTENHSVFINSLQNSPKSLLELICSASFKANGTKVENYWIKCFSGIKDTEILTTIEKLHRTNDRILVQVVTDLINQNEKSSTIELIINLPYFKFKYRYERDGLILLCRQNLLPIQISKPTPISSYGYIKKECVPDKLSRYESVIAKLTGMEIE